MIIKQKSQIDKRNRGGFHDLPKALFLKGIDPLYVPIKLIRIYSLNKFHLSIFELSYSQSSAFRI